MSRVSGLRVTLVLGLGLLAAGGAELVLEARGSGDWLFSFSLAWTIALAAYAVFAGLAALAIGLELLRPGSLGNPVGRLQDQLDSLPASVRWVLAAFAALLPTVLFLGPWGAPLSMASIRASLFLLSAAAAAVLAPKRAIDPLPRFVLAVLTAATVFAVAKRLILVTDYPFKLGWSEGNRLWDYSLYFRWAQYGLGPQVSFPTYLTPGRHGLWGLPFLLPELPIWSARLWDALLWIVPYLTLAWVLVRRYASNLARLASLGAVAWIFLYLTLGGIFAPLMLSAILIAWLHHPRHTGRTMAVAALASLYAGLSRWTWLLAPAAWAVLLVLLSPEREESRTRRWRNAAWVGIAGALGGIASQAIMAVAFPRPDAVFSTAASHPLLWYRMLPNPTNPIGVLPGLLIGIGPLMAVLAWAVRQYRLPWERLEQGFAALTVVVLFGASLAASAKIGGGSNLHNADMLLLTVLFLAAVAFKWISQRGGITWPPRSDLVRALAVLAVLVPALDAVRSGGPLSLPGQVETRRALATIREEAAAAAEHGEVLFIDQRQLFTFGELSDVALEMDYELKDMMNQAMGSNEDYFERFRDDLQRQRFSLIVSDPLPGGLQGSGHQFGEENDAWFTYVAEPLRAHYEPYIVLDEVGAWLLRPRE